MKCITKIKCKTAMLRSSLCDFSDTHILVKGTISIAQVLVPTDPHNVVKKQYLKVLLHLLIAKVK